MITLNVTNIDYFNHIIKMLSFIVLYISAIRLDYLPQYFMEWINSIVNYFLWIISPFFNDCVVKNFNIMQFVFPNFFFQNGLIQQSPNHLNWENLEVNDLAWHMLDNSHSNILVLLLQYETLPHLEERRGHP